ncbi:hypothetical protein [Pseudothermotoga thermarum]|nr:hypothetical protein [Pseudothermotoga thermarum]
MLDFDTLNKLLPRVVIEKNCKIWICEKVGKRLSCIAKYGEEHYCETRIIYEDEKYVVFSQNLNDEQTQKQIVEVIKSARKG